MSQERNGIIYCYFFFLPGMNDSPLFNKSLFSTTNRFKLTYEETGKINDMCAQVTMCSRACKFFVVTPGIRKVRIDQPVLKIDSIEMKDPSQFSLFNHFLSQCQCRYPSVIEYHHVLYSGIL